jgi:predicted nucleic acid-binding protein
LIRPGIGNFKHIFLVTWRKTTHFVKGLSTLPFYDLKKSIILKSRLFVYYLSKNGIKLRSRKDLLIAKTAIENDLYLLHNDTDFTNDWKVVEELEFSN